MWIRDSLILGGKHGLDGCVQNCGRNVQDGELGDAEINKDLGFAKLRTAHCSVGRNTKILY